MRVTIQDYRTNDIAFSQLGGLFIKATSRFV